MQLLQLQLFLTHGRLLKPFWGEEETVSIFPKLTNLQLSRKTFLGRRWVGYLVHPRSLQFHGLVGKSFWKEEEGQAICPTYICPNCSCLGKLFGDQRKGLFVSPNYSCLKYGCSKPIVILKYQMFDTTR